MLSFCVIRTKVLYHISDTLQTAIREQAVPLLLLALDSVSISIFIFISVSFSFSPLLIFSAMLPPPPSPSPPLQNLPINNHCLCEPVRTLAWQSQKRDFRLRYPVDVLGLSTFVPHRPLHPLRLCFICHRQRKGSRPRSLRSLGMTRRSTVYAKFRHSAFRHSQHAVAKKPPVEKPQEAWCITALRRTHGCGA